MGDGGGDLWRGLAGRPWEDGSHGYGPGTQVIGDGVQPVDFGARRPADLGRIGEDLTRQDLLDRGYVIIAEQAQIKLPGGSRSGRVP